MGTARAASTEVDGAWDGQTRYRHGVRVLQEPEQRRILTIGSVLYLVAGASVVQLWLTARADVDHPGAYVTSGLLVIVLGVSVLVTARWAPPAMLDRAFPAVTLTLLFGGALAVPLILHFVGFDAFAIGSTVYVLPLILGYHLLRRTLTAALLGTIAVGHAALLLSSEGVVAPPSQYVFLLAILTSAGVLLGGLVDALDRSARSEAAARTSLALANASLAVRVDDQVDELQRLGRLRRFLSPQIADAVVSSGSESFLQPHRREIAVFFCDLRGFTGFASEVEPEDVMSVLDRYYETVGAELRAHDATVGAFAGDGIMAYFNDPTPCEAPAASAVSLALAVRRALEPVRAEWARLGYDLGFGIGIAMGHATLGVIGFEGRSDYTALGTVVNRSARLSDHAAHGQILIDGRTRAMVADLFPLRPLPELTLKGFARPVPCAEVLEPSPGALPGAVPVA